MTASTGSRTATKWDVALFLFLFALALGRPLYTKPHPPQLSAEAIVRAGVGADLLDGQTRGRQGLVGSAYWAPLPTLLALPLLKLPPPFRGEQALPLVSIASAALLAVFLNAWLRRNGVRALLRLAAVLAVFLSPPLRAYAEGGGGEVLFALFAVAAVCFLMHWWETDQLRSLSYLALALMLAVITRYQAVVLFAGALAFVGLHLALRRLRTRNGAAPEKSYAEATLIVFLVPATYAVLLWVAANWLIMGDAAFFLRGFSSVLESWHSTVTALRVGCGWDLVLAIGIVALVSWALRGLGWKHGALCVEAPALAACALLWFGPFAASPAPEDATGAELSQVVSDLTRDHSGDWVLVSGYRGDEAAHDMPGHGNPHLNLPHAPGLCHTLSLYLDQALKNTKGRRLYLLVPEPRGADRWEDVNLKYPDLYPREDAPFAMYEKNWKHWRLFRVIRNDETDHR